MRQAGGKKKQLKYWRPDRRGHHRLTHGDGADANAGLPGQCSDDAEVAGELSMTMHMRATMSTRKMLETRTMTMLATPMMVFDCPNTVDGGDGDEDDGRQVW